MAVTKSAYLAVIADQEYKLDCAPFPRSESKRQKDLLVNGVATASAVSGSKTEVYYTYFLWEGKSYSFQRGVLITEETGEITLKPVAGKPAPAPNVEKPAVAEELKAAGVSVEEALKAAAFIEATAPVAEEIPAAPKPKKTRKPKSE